uniref:Cytochrome P450 n=1 Tax=Chironomus tentans TaxID=7153 RepID=A0A1W6R7G5_CHITE|nr:cytochrome P450 [Chironomus tentans]
MILYLIGVIILLIYFYFRKVFSFWKDHGFPYIKGSLPMGSVGSVRTKEAMCEFMRREYDNFKNKAPAFGIYFMTRPSLVITDPDLVKEVLIGSFDNFCHRGFEFNKNTDPLWNNLAMINNLEEWKVLRVKISPTFTSGKMKMMFPIVLECVDRMIEHLKGINRGSLEMKEIFSELTTEVIGNVAFGLDVNCIGNPDNEFRKIAKRVLEPSNWDNFKFLFNLMLPKVAKFLNMSINPKFITDYFLEIVRSNLEYREKNNIQRNDFFQLLINIKNSEQGMTLNEMAANCFIFFLAGFETSSSVLTFCSYELALNQDIQDRLRTEIDEVIKKHKGEVTYDAIAEMEYLSKVINETMRKYPIFDTAMRQSSKDFKIPNSNLVIPGKSMIMIPTIGIHNDDRFYKNPDKFDPERFNEENVQKRHPLAFIPFSEGPRICLGLRFALMEIKISMVYLLRNFRILPSNKTLIPMQYSLTSSFQSPKHGMGLKLEEL